MSLHKTAFVPLATGYFQSPELLLNGRKADTGLFAESLIYYDSVYVHVDNPEQFANFISLLIQQGLSYEKLIEIIEDGTLRFFGTVMIMPFLGTGNPKIVTSLYSIQEEAIYEPNYFSKRFLDFEGLRDSFSSLTDFDSKTFEKFYEVAQKASTIFSGNDIGDDVIDNAYKDCINPKRFKLVAKSFYKELYKVHKMGKLPNFLVGIKEVNAQNIHQIARNIDSTILGQPIGETEYKIHELEFIPKIKPIPSLENTEIKSTFPHSPIVFAGISNLYINCAARLNCDLFLPNPISEIIGDKLFEISDFELENPSNKVQNIIEKLESDVEFPDLSQLVNSDEIDFVKVLEIRNKAKKFRDWLQDESERDRDAIIAYHNEVAKQTGFTNIAKRSLNIFGVLASASVAGAISYKVSNDPQLSTMVGSATGAMSSKIVEKGLSKATEKLFDYGANKFGEEWKPVCFGNWYRNDIEKFLKK